MSNDLMNNLIQKKIINGDEVSTILLNARTGLSIGLQLAKIFAPSLATASATLEERGYYDHKMMAAQLLMSMDSEQVINLVFQLLGALAVNGTAIKPEEYYRGNYSKMIEHLTFVLEANFESFFVESISKNLTSIFNLMIDKQEQAEQEKQ